MAGVLAWLAHRATPPPFAEFDGQVIRQWMVKGDSESPDEWHVAVDDGTRETAWDFDVGGERYRRLTPGTFVHVRVNLRDRAELTVAPVEPPAVARPLAGVAADQERAATRGLPDPEDLVTPQEAAVILGRPTASASTGSTWTAGRGGAWSGSTPGRSGPCCGSRCGTRPTAGGQRPRRVARARRRRRLPDRPGGGVTVPPLIAILSVHGTVPAGPKRG